MKLWELYNSWDTGRNPKMTVYMWDDDYDSLLKGFTDEISNNLPWKKFRYEGWGQWGLEMDSNRLYQAVYMFKGFEVEVFNCKDADTMSVHLRREKK